MTDITKTWQLYSDHEPPKHIDIPLPYLPQGGFVAPLGVQRYIREDLVRGDANEPLADGQYRWVYLGKTWHVAFVFKNLTGEGFSFELGHIERGENDIEKVGPVVKPPETEWDERACPDSGSATA